jgi:hypothetical protein
MKRTIYPVLFLSAACLFWVHTAFADVLLLSNNKQIEGNISLVANDYIEFLVGDEWNNKEWLKVPKKVILAILNREGKIIYPRDKFDENALNYGRVKIRNEKEKEIYLNRKKANQARQIENEKKESKRYKIAALLGGLSGLMLWAFMDSR